MTMRTENHSNPARSNPAYSGESSPARRPLWGILLLYGFLVGAAAWRSLEAIGADGVCYLLLASHYAKGEWSLAVSGLWSPMLSWLLAPFVRLGFDPLHGFYGLSAIFGAGFVIVVWMLAGRFGLSSASRILATVCGAVMAAVFAVATVTPDLLLADLLALYFYLTLDPDFGRRSRLGWLCGITAGLGYLAKAYAGPFFLVHFTCLSAWGVLTRGGASRGRERLRPWVCGLAGFLLVAGPWIGIISSKYGHFTLSTAAGYNHAVIAPNVARVEHPMGTGLWKVPAGRLNVWEDPSVLPQEDWSPFADWENFRHQAGEMLHSGSVILRILWQLDFLGLGVAALIAAAVLAVRRGGDDRERRIVQWTLITTATYCSGYLFVFAIEFRYYWPVGLILLMLVFHLAGRLNRSVRARGRFSDRRAGRALMAAAVVIPAVSFVVYPIQAYVRWQQEPPRGQAYQEVARDLSERGVRGPMASNEWERGLILSYHLNERYIGRPATLGAGLEEALRSHGVGTLLVWGPWEDTNETFARRGGFDLVVRYKAETRPGLPMDLAVYRVRANE